MTIYSAAQWPLQQSLNEVKHKSGLFTATATFLRPVGNDALPTEIQTSIGPLEIYPDPVVATGTDGFQTLTATAYGDWDSTITEVVFNYDIATIPVFATEIIRCSIPEGCSVTRNGQRVTIPCGGIIFERLLRSNFRVIIETAYVRKIGDAVPQIPRRGSVTGLRILNLELVDISNTEISISEFFPGISPDFYTGNFSKVLTKQSPFLSSLKKNTYGTILETEATYSLPITSLFFGAFNGIIPPCPPPA